jgi:hypothetical protein
MGSARRLVHVALQAGAENAAIEFPRARGRNFTRALGNSPAACPRLPRRGASGAGARRVPGGLASE